MGSSTSFRLIGGDFVILFIAYFLLYLFEAHHCPRLNWVIPSVSISANRWTFRHRLTPQYPWEWAHCSVQATEFYRPCQYHQILTGYLFVTILRHSTYGNGPPVLFKRPRYFLSLIQSVVVVFYTSLSFLISLSSSLSASRPPFSNSNTLSLNQRMCAREPKFSTGLWEHYY